MCEDASQKALKRECADLVANRFYLCGIWDAKCFLGTGVDSYTGNSQAIIRIGFFLCWLDAEYEIRSHENRLASSEVC